MMPAFDRRGVAMAPQDFDQKKGKDSQKLLDILKAHLSYLAQRGELDSEIDDETMEYYRILGKAEVPPEVTEKLLLSARRAVLERRLRIGARNLPKAFYRFGQLLREIRSAADVDVSEIREVIGRGPLEIEDIESGEKNPLGIDPSILAEIVILFSLPFETVEKSLRVDATQRATVSSIGSGLARTPTNFTNKRTSIATAFEDLAHHLARSVGGEVEISAAFLETLKDEIRKMKREDLLTKTSG